MTGQDLADYADRFIVLKDLDSLAANLSTSYPLMNASQTQLFQRTLAYHHDSLFEGLFPYISRNPDNTRSFTALRARYAKPAVSRSGVRAAGLQNAKVFLD